MASALLNVDYGTATMNAVAFNRALRVTFTAMIGARAAGSRIQDAPRRADGHLVAGRLCLAANRVVRVGNERPSQTDCIRHGCDARPLAHQYVAPVHDHAYPRRHGNAPDPEARVKQHAVGGDADYGAHHGSLKIGPAFNECNGPDERF